MALGRSGGNMSSETVAAARVRTPGAPRAARAQAYLAEPIPREVLFVPGGGRHRVPASPRPRVSAPRSRELPLTVFGSGSIPKSENRTFAVCRHDDPRADDERDVALVHRLLIATYVCAETLRRHDRNTREARQRHAPTKRVFTTLLPLTARRWPRPRTRPRRGARAFCLRRARRRTAPPGRPWATFSPPSSRRRWPRG